MITTLIAGNWKMNGLPQDIGELKAIKTAMHEKAFHCDILLCVPAPLIMLFAQEGGEDISIGAQDCHEKTSGAHTGDMSAQLLKAVGAKAVIVGHSERRMDHHETSQMVARKALAAQQAGLFPIICVGETLQERDEGKAVEVVSAQLSASLEEGVINEDYAIAYEPIWAIGTGRTPSHDDIHIMHQALRHTLMEVDAEKGQNRHILYGGSVKGSNAKEILAIENVNGALVGGASLKAADFLAIIRAKDSN